jgi:PPOX class probable F420-dependent enzyme
MSMIGRDDRRRRREGRVAIIALMSVSTADQHTAHAARLDRFLHEEPVVWLSTVRPDGAPHIVPIWFTWDGTSLLVFSKPGAQKVRNVRVSPIAMLALGEPEDDFDVAMAEARVELLDEPATELPWAHIEKYGSRMAALGLTPDQFVATYSQVIRITPTRTVPWHGRTRPHSLRDGASDGHAGWRSALRPLRSWLRPGPRPALGTSA